VSPVPIMLSQTYDALVAAGAPEEKARAAAEEIAAYEDRLREIATGIATIKGEIGAVSTKLDGLDTKFETKIGAMAGYLKLIIWATGINAAATIAILGVLL
jgi:hypothetical protein